MGVEGARESLDDVLTRGRWLFVPLVTMSVIWVLTPSWSDWGVHQAGADHLLSSRWWHLYADQPGVQIGPLGLLFAVAPGTEAGCRIVSGILVLPALLLLERLVGHPITFRAAPFAVAWALVSLHVQPGDLLVALCALGSVLAARSGNAVILGALLGAAGLVKPSGYFLLPLVFLLPQDRARAWLSVTVFSLLYVPFAFDPGSWAAVSPQTGGPNDGSLLTAVDGSLWWIRPTQLVVCLVAGWWAARRGEWPAALLAITTARVMLDPSSQTYQAMPIVLAAVAFDETRSGQRTLVAVAFIAASMPWMTVQFEPFALGARAMLLCVLLASALTAKPPRTVRRLPQASARTS